MKALARWEEQTRQWATETAHNLALDLYHNQNTATRPYRLGVVLEAGEKAWTEVPVRFNLDWPVLGERALPSARGW